MQARLAFSKRCELAKRKNANEESRLRSTLERCEKEYERTMKSMFVERHDVRTSIRDLRKVKRISLDTKPLVESDNVDNRVARLGDGSAPQSPCLVARHTNLTRTIGMTQRTYSMPDLHESAPNLKPKNLPLIPDRKSPTQPNTKNDNRSHSQARKRCQTFPEGSARETPSECDDLSDLGTCSPQISRSMQDFPAQPRTPLATRHRASLASIHGNDGKFLRRFRTLTIPAVGSRAEFREQSTPLVRGKEGADFDGNKTEGRDAVAVLSPRPSSSLPRRPRSCSVRTISAPGVLENQMLHMEGRSRSLTLTDGCHRPRSKTMPENGYGQSGTISSRPGEQGWAGDQVKLLEVDRGDLTNSPRFRRRLSPSAGIARLRQEGDAAMATRALVSSYRRDQGMAKTQEELKLTREEARKRIEKWKETKTLDEEKGDQRKSGARRTFMSIIRFVLAVNAFKSLRNRKVDEESACSDEET